MVAQIPDMSFTTQNASLIKLTDKLRDFRFAMRTVKAATRRLQSDRSGLFHTLTDLASATKSMNPSTGGGTGAMPSRRAAHYAAEPDAFGFRRYVVAGQTQKGRTIALTFGRAHYHAAKQVMAAAGVSNFLIHQEAFVKAWQATSANTDEENEPDVWQLCEIAAAYSAALSEVQPALFPTHFTYEGIDRQIDTNVFLAVSLALLGVVASDAGQDVDNAETIPACVAATMARYTQIADALDHQEDAAAMAKRYQDLAECLV